MLASRRSTIEVQTTTRARRESLPAGRRPRHPTRQTSPTARRPHPRTSQHPRPTRRPAPGRRHRETEMRSSPRLPPRDRKRAKRSPAPATAGCSDVATALVHSAPLEQESSRADLDLSPCPHRTTRISVAVRRADTLGSTGIAVVSAVATGLLLSDEAGATIAQIERSDTPGRDDDGRPRPTSTDCCIRPWNRQSSSAMAGNPSVDPRRTFGSPGASRSLAAYDNSGGRRPQ